MSDQKETFVHKVTLSTGKIVLVRDPEIRDQEMAGRVAASTVKGDSPFLMALGMQKEMLKMLVVQINGKAPTVVELENLDGLFSYAEYQQMIKVVGKVAGLEDDLGNFKIELQKHGS